MKFKTLTGAQRRVSNIKKHLIDWDKKSRSKFQFEVKKFLEKHSESFNFLAENLFGLIMWFLKSFL